ncbi:MAG TPA: alpha/beta hydrolase [Pseudonocardiaceae bacterium]|jgi:pimeloyl-ACP methyl ester carboxylesterase|nr:alpha/beta hydrolase [Pseudonocardiaceae bacterium]
MPYVNTSAGRVWYEERGTGAPVVLLHATLHDHHDFDRTAERLSIEYRTIAVDWPGHGRSDPVAEPTATLLADVLVEVLDGLDVERAVLIGNSVGGFAAARLAADQPDRVAGIVLVNTGGFIKPSLAGRVFTGVLGTPWLARLLFPRLVPAYMKARNDDDAAVGARARARARTKDGARVAASLWRSFGKPSYDLRARHIAVPTLLVWGSKDPVLPISLARQAQDAIPAATLHMFDTGHVVFASDPAGFGTVVEPFIAATFLSVPPA